MVCRYQPQPLASVLITTNFSLIILHIMFKPNLVIIFLFIYENEKNTGCRTFVRFHFPAPAPQEFSVIVIGMTS